MSILSPSSLRGGLTLLLLSLLPWYGADLHAQAGGSGNISGQVSNVATRAFLEGAVVQIAGTNRSTVTTREGRFHFSRVPAGEHTLIVRYTGLDTQEVPVVVQEGSTVTSNVGLTSGIYEMDEFTVAGLREGTALAVTMQRQAPNVKNVVSSDIFGNVADGNIGDFLQRLPGMTAVYVGADVRQVQIRGVNPDLNSVTMDGQRLASAQSGNLGRAFEFEQTSLGLIETIEVTKAPTPDMDADSIGGSVNLVTKSAFDRAISRYFSYTIGGVHRPKYNLDYRNNRLRAPIHKWGPSMNMTYSDVLGENQNIGILLTGTYHSQPGGGTASLMDYERIADEGPAYIWRTRVPRPAGATRTRLASGLKIDYRFSDQTTISFNTMYNWFHENNDTRTMFLQTPVNGVAIAPGYTDTFTETLPHINSMSNMSITVNDKSGRTYQFQPSVSHRFDDMRIDYSLTYSNSATYYDHSQEDSHFKSRPRGVVGWQLRNIGWTVDRSNDMRWPEITQTAGPDMYDLSNYSDLLLTQPDRRGYDTITGGKFDFRKDLDLAIPTYFKTGISYRQQDREIWRNSRRYRYVGPDGIWGNEDDQLEQFLDTSGHYHENSTFKGYQAPPWVNPYAVARHRQEYPELWQEDVAFGAVERLRWRQEITETVSAAYAMGSATLGKVNLLTGLRMEDTRTDGEGPLQYISPEERARRAAWEGPVTAQEARRRAETEWEGRQRSKGSYRKLFPGAHVRYEALPGLVTRVSWSTGIGRPAFGSIIPLTNANDENQTVSINNTALEPQYSNNYDLSAEYYFEPVGLLSLGLFRKDLQDFIFQDRGRTVEAGPNNGFGGLYEGYTLITQANGGKARIQGFEVNYNQQLSFLPGWMQGFGVFANYTHMTTKGDYSEEGQTSTTEIAGFRPRTGNVGFSYGGRGLDVRVQMNWVGKWLAGYSANRALLRYFEPRTTVNVKTKYAFSDRLGVFFDVENIFSEDNTRTYWLHPDRIAETRTLAPKIVTGISGRF